MRIAALLFTSIVSLFVTSTASAEYMSKERLAMEKLYSSALIEKALTEDDPAARLIRVEQLVIENGEWVGISSPEGILNPLHVTNYLLQRGHEDAASRLIRSGAVEGWVSYPFQEGVVSDYSIALKIGAVKYIEALVDFKASQVNRPIQITQDGNETLPIAFLATNDYVEKSYYEAALLALLRGGADAFINMPNGVSPMLLANTSNNTKFIQIVQSFRDKQFDTPEGFFKNSPLSSSQLLEMQAIADLITEESRRYSKLPTSKVHDLWVKMILKGYNTPADMLYDILRQRDNFDIDQRNDMQMTALTATALSSIYGGNVEYAERLIKRGANPNQLITFSELGKEDVKLNIIQMSLQRDNYKIVALMIREGVDFVGIPGGGENDLLLSQAIQQNALKSVMVIRESLKRLVERASE